jgi:hypothetical protein
MIVNANTPVLTPAESISNLWFSGHMHRRIESFSAKKKKTKL